MERIAGDRAEEQPVVGEVVEQQRTRRGRARQHATVDHRAELGDRGERRRRPDDDVHVDVDQLVERLLGVGQGESLDALVHRDVAAEHPARIVDQLHGELGGGADSFAERGVTGAWQQESDAQSTIALPGHRRGGRGAGIGGVGCGLGGVAAARGHENERETGGDQSGGAHRTTIELAVA
ncbi:MAG: hypothetical protein WKF58_18495 [Ilumatobacteraceae bacterium]